MNSSLHLVLLWIAWWFFTCSSAQDQKSTHKANHHHQHEWNMTLEDMVNEFNNPERDQWQKPDQIIDLFGDVRGKTIMDIGAGAGYFSFKLAAKGARVIAAELHEGYLEFIKNTQATMNLAGHIEPRLVPPNTAKLGHHEADGVLLVHVYHHIENRTNYFSEIYEQLKPGGKILILETPPQRCPDAPPPAHFRLTASEIESELSGAGFTEFSVDSTLLECQIAVLALK